MSLPSLFVFLTLGWLLLLVPMVVSICDEFQLMDPAGLGNITGNGILTESGLKMEFGIPGPVEANGNERWKSIENMIGGIKMKKAWNHDLNGDPTVPKEEIPIDCETKSQSEVSSGIKCDCERNRTEIIEETLEESAKLLEEMILLPMSALLMGCSLVGMYGRMRKALNSGRYNDKSHADHKEEPIETMDHPQEIKIDSEMVTPQRNSARENILRRESGWKYSPMPDSYKTPDTVRRPKESKLPKENSDVQGRKFESPVSPNYDLKNDFRGRIGHVLGKALRKKGNDRIPFEEQSSVSVTDENQQHVELSAVCRTTTFSSRASGTGTKVICQSSAQFTRTNVDLIRKWNTQIAGGHYKVEHDSNFNSFTIILLDPMRAVNKSNENAFIDRCKGESNVGRSERPVPGDGNSDRKINEQTNAEVNLKGESEPAEEHESNQLSDSCAGSDRGPDRNELMKSCVNAKGESELAKDNKANKMQEPNADGSNELTESDVSYDNSKPKSIDNTRNENEACNGCKVELTADGSNVSIYSEKENAGCGDENKQKYAVNEPKEKMFCDSCKDESAAAGSNASIDSENKRAGSDDQEFNEKSDWVGKGESSAAESKVVQESVTRNHKGEQGYIFEGKQNEMPTSDSKGDPNDSDSDDSNENFVGVEGKSELAENHKLDQLLQYHQQRIPKIKEGIEQLKTVRAELEEYLDLYKLIARALTEEVDTNVSIKCNGDFEYILAKSAKSWGEGLGECAQTSLLALYQEYDRTLYALQCQALAADIGTYSPQALHHPALIEIENKIATCRAIVQASETVRKAREIQFLQDVQLVKIKIMLKDPESLAVNAALATWPEDEIPKIVGFGSAKREGAQEQSGEGSALLSKTNNHNATRAKASSGQVLTQNGPVRKDRLRPGKN